MGRYLIVGASSDIGQEVCNQLQKQGHEVLTTARNSQVIQPNYILVTRRAEGGGLW